MDNKIHPLIDNQKIELLQDDEIFKNDEFDGIILHKYDCENNRYDIRIPLNGGKPLIVPEQGNIIPKEIIKEVQNFCNQERLRETLIDINIAINDITKGHDNNTLFTSAIKNLSQIFGLGMLIYSDKRKTYCANLYEIYGREFYIIYHFRKKTVVIGENINRLVMFLYKNNRWKYKYAKNSLTLTRKG